MNEVETEANIINHIELSMGEELAYVYDWTIGVLGNVEKQEVERLLRDAIDKVRMTSDDFQ
jgi:hypothetical protein